MAIVAEYKTLYLLYYKDISKEMTGQDSIYQKMINRMLEEFEVYGLTTEKKSELLSQTVMQIIPQFEQLASNNARELITLEHDVPIKDNQASEIERKRQYYDDELLKTIVEKQSDLASFAVNANSDSAQTAINDLKEKMHNLETRVVQVNGNTCPAPTPTIAVPTGLIVTNATVDSLLVSWLPVQGVTLYAVYRDGIQIASTGSLNITDTGLLSITKYAYNVKAFSGSLYSDLSATVIGTTIV